MSKRKFYFNYANVVMKVLINVDLKLNQSLISKCHYCVKKFSANIVV